MKGAEFLQAFGLVIMSAGFERLAQWAGIVILGAGMMAWGLALEVGRKGRR